MIAAMRTSRIAKPGGLPADAFDRRRIANGPLTPCRWRGETIVERCVPKRRFGAVTAYQPCYCKGAVLLDPNRWAPIGMPKTLPKHARRNGPSRPRDRVGRLASGEVAARPVGEGDQPSPQEQQRGRLGNRRRDADVELVD